MTENETRRKRGLSGNALRIWGMVFVFAGIVGRGVIQTHMLGMKGVNSSELLNIMENAPNAMMLTTFSIILQILETCALPIFAMLLVTGMQNTADFKTYFQRVLGLALVSEIPYNLAFSGKLFDFGSRNAVFGVLLALFMLYMFEKFADEEKKRRLLKFFIVIVTFLWCQMLKVDHGAALVVLVSILWAFRKKEIFLNFVGATAAMICSLISPFYLASPMGFLAVHSYNGTKSTNTHKYNYLMYPILLIIGWVFGILL